jgi:ATP-dependent RNA helicase SUPV3L1/SUV3
MKREKVNQMIKNIPGEDRLSLRKAGVKIGRYHIFLPRMLKPSAVDLRVKLWKLYFPKELEYNIPVSGLNFLKNETKEKEKFMLICGFENFDKFYIRVDILERLFLQIINNTKDGAFKIDSNMINLIGCNKENFYKLLELMQYKRKKVNKAKEEFFNYQPKHVKRKKSPIVKKSNKGTPFDKLSVLKLR